MVFNLFCFFFLLLFLLLLMFRLYSTLDSELKIQGQVVWHNLAALQHYIFLKITVIPV